MLCSSEYKALSLRKCSDERGLTVRSKTNLFLIDENLVEQRTPTGFFHLCRTAEMWYQVFWSHKEQSPCCTGLLTSHGTWPPRKGWGCHKNGTGKCCVSLFFQETQPFQGSRDQSTWQKTSNFNYYFQVGLSQTPLGNDERKKILLSTTPLLLPQGFFQGSQGACIQPHSQQ